MFRRISELFKNLTASHNRLMLAFAVEGILFQVAMSSRGFGSNLFATNLGATDTQISLIQTVGCIVTLLMLLPVGVIADRSKSSKTVPVAMLILSSVAFIGQALVPWMGDIRMVMFFVFIGLSSGTTGAYNSQWQSMFGDLVDPRDRNFTYALRNRVMMALGMVVPMLCGVLMSGADNSEVKLRILSTFMFISGVFLLVQAFVVTRIPENRHEKEEVDESDRFSLNNIGSAVSGAIKCRPFMSFVLVSMLLYTSWHIDWSMWYIGQTQYMGFSEAQLSYFNAINCFLQIFMLGFMARMNQKKSPHFTICINALSLTVSPIVMMSCLLLPAGSIRSWGFLAIHSFVCMWECGISMCMVQMLLEAVPVKHRALTISLYTILTTVSNCIMPLLGVRLYTAFGANEGALVRFMSIVMVYRLSVTVYLYIRYRLMKKQGKLVTFN